MSSLIDAIRNEWTEHEAAARGENRSKAWMHLERSHVLSQQLTIYHIISHWKMLEFAWRTKDAKEFFAQIHRLVLAGPASILGLFPRGNVGTSRVSAFRTMEIPEELKQIIRPDADF